MDGNKQQKGTEIIARKALFELNNISYLGDKDMIRTRVESAKKLLEVLVSLAQTDIL